MAKSKKNGDTAANIGFEAKLWLAADKLRNNMDAAEYKHVVLATPAGEPDLYCRWTQVARRFERSDERIIVSSVPRPHIGV